MASRTLKITDEKTAFAALEKALREELGDTTYNIEFVGWPKLQIKLDGPGYNSTITSDVAEVLVDLQVAINRSYARLVHQSADSRTLTGEERSKLQFKAEVKKGSSIVNVDLGEYLKTLTHELVTKMSSEALVICVLGVAVVAGSVLAYKNYLKARSEDKKIDAETQKAIALSQEETRRLATMASVVQKEPAVAAAQVDFDDARNTLIKSVGDARHLAVNDVTIDRQTARTLATSKRTASKEAQLNGTYMIMSVDLRQQDYVKLRVQNAQDGKEFSATFQDDSLDKAQIGLLQEAEWGRTPVYLSINATILRGEVTSAGIISVTPQPVPAKKTTRATQRIVRKRVTNRGST
ncbi:hypothetical protein [Burkholderia gladioli]|uniref:hypothetical protein n=2 Tax=Burkholderia gladioli TaxID=28095 RepID=UPI00163F77C5|nr:hypothetical protein [Burkholderia gladioli]